MLMPDMQPCLNPGRPLCSVSVFVGPKLAEYIKTYLILCELRVFVFFWRFVCVFTLVSFLYLYTVKTVTSCYFCMLFEVDLLKL